MRQRVCEQQVTGSGYFHNRNGNSGGSMNSVMKQIREVGVLPLMTVNDPEDAVKVGEALLKGGLPVAEVTFRTEAAEKAIELMAKELPELLLGAGTVLSTGQASQARDAGAKFCVSPGFNPSVVSHCHAMEFPIAPGVCTPTDIEAAMEHGLTILKFFPAGPMGGLKLLKAVAAPYGSISFIPTGGISADNLGEYLSFDKVIACGGSWIAPKDLIAEGKFNEITERAKEALAIAEASRDND